MIDIINAIRGISTKIQNLAAPEYDGVYVDSVNGDTIANGATGTPNKPLSTIAEALTTAATNKVQNIYDYDFNNFGLTLPSGMTVGMVFIGRDHNADGIDLNNKDHKGSAFKNLFITGTASAAFGDFFDCIIQSDKIVANVVERCILSGTYGASSGNFTDCSFGLDDQAPDATISVATAITIRRGSGKLTLTDIVGGTTNIYGSGLALTIDATCTAGTINVFGSAIVVNNSTGTCVVNDYTIEKKIGVTYP